VAGDRAALDVPGRELYRGRPSGSAMPLVWAHAEHLKLVRSLRDGQVYDLPPQTRQRYVADRTTSPYACWRFNHRLQRIRRGQVLRLETLAACVVRWSADGWTTVHDSPSSATGLDVWVTDLPTGGLTPGATVVFTFRWSAVNRWEQVNFDVTVAEESRLRVDPA
jgi:glucoamylase